jgi:hypothetical protein
MFRPSRKFFLSIIVSVSTVVISALSFGCSGPESEEHKSVKLPPILAPGVISVDVLEAGQPEHYWLYEVRPASGLVQLVRESTFQDYKHEDIPEAFQEPSGAIEACAKNPKARSPDGLYWAYCRGAGSEEFYVSSATSAQTLHVWKPSKRIAGFAWAPNSNSVAILRASGHLGMSPLELLAFASGHPVNHDTIFLDVLDVRTGKTTEYVVRKNVISAFTRITSWSD